MSRCGVDTQAGAATAAASSTNTSTASATCASGCKAYLANPSERLSRRMSPLDVKTDGARDRRSDDRWRQSLATGRASEFGFQEVGSQDAIGPGKDPARYDAAWLAEHDGGQRRAVRKNCVQYRLRSFRNRARAPGLRTNAPVR